MRKGSWAFFSLITHKSARSESPIAWPFSVDKTDFLVTPTQINTFYRDSIPLYLLRFCYFWFVVVFSPNDAGIRGEIKICSDLLKARLHWLFLLRF